MMKTIVITYVCCFFSSTPDFDVWYTVSPIVMREMKAPQCVRPPEKEYILGFIVIHQTRGLVIVDDIIM